MKYLRRLLIWLVYLLPAALYCSYYPIIKLGESSSMNFELSLPLVWLVLFDIVSFASLISLVWRKPPGRAAKKASTRAAKSDSPVRTGAGAGRFTNLPGLSDRKFFLFSLFPFYATLSIFWSANPTRAILTAGIIWLIFFAVFALIYVLPLLELPSNFRSNCLRSFLISSVIICLVCWIQCFLDIAGVGREATLMCRGCTYLSFGFPHPSGLAIEPQFMGNLLLAPTLVALYLLIFYPGGEKSSEIYSRHILLIMATLFSATLFLTFSRGAIYAYAVALFVMLIFAFRRHVFRPSLIIIPVATFIFIVTVQGIFTVIGPTHGSFLAGVSRSIHQLSLGIIDIRPQTPQNSQGTQDSQSSENSVSSEDPKNSETSSPSGQDANSNSGASDATPPNENLPAEPFFEGYVPESTNVRLDLNQAAIDTWLSAPGYPESRLNVGLRCFKFGCCPCTGLGYLTPTTVLFGVGLGGAGVAMYRNSFITHIYSPKEIVQHQGISLLLELGLVGIALALFSLYLAFFSRDARAHLRRHPMLPLLASLVIAYLVTLNFFSGLPNALQIYLMPPLLYMIFTDARLPKSSQNPKKRKKSL